MATIPTGIRFLRVSTREKLLERWNSISEGTIAFVLDTRSIFLKYKGEPIEFGCQAPLQNYKQCPRVVTDNFLLEESKEIVSENRTGWTLISQVEFTSGAFRKFGLVGRSEVWLLEFKLFVEVEPGLIRIFSDKPVSFFDRVLTDIIEEIKKLC